MEFHFVIFDQLLYNFIHGSAEIYLKRVKLAKLAICDLDCNTPWTCTAKIAEEATLRPEPVDSPELRARIKELFDFIMQYFELHANEEEEEI